MRTLSSPIDLIKKSVNIFFEKNNLIFFLKIYSVLIPFSLINYFQDIYLNTQAKNLNLSDASTFLNQNMWFASIYMIVGLAYLIISFWVAASGILAVDNVISGKTLSFKEIFKNTYKKLVPYSLLLIVTGFLTILGFLLLVIPGVLIMVWYSFAGFELIVNNKSVKESMSGSKLLVKGRFGPIFGRMIIFGIFMILFHMIFSLVPYNIGSIITPLFGALFILPYFLLYKEL